MPDKGERLDYSIVIYDRDDVVLNLTLTSKDFYVFRNTLLQQWFFSDKVVPLEHGEALKSKEEKEK